MYNLNLFIAGLHAAKGFGPVTFKNLINEFGSVEALFNEASFNILKFSPKLKSVFNFALNFDDTNLKALLKKYGINIVYYHEEEYPELLKTINDPPIGIYYKVILRDLMIIIFFLLLAQERVLIMVEKL